MMRIRIALYISNVVGGAACADSASACATVAAAATAAAPNGAGPPAVDAPSTRDAAAASAAAIAAAAASITCSLTAKVKGCERDMTSASTLAFFTAKSASAEAEATRSRCSK
eukprot:CAMPEP_0182564650 /NCGR_PEP_ID=MMETSP1324-20130603/6547_1 /TAXON_ID=236786 /ORGANISM="Florenciella sp., Strain RCC1587" /LENGTH=111 /DNA_ID=CAMNT_0024778151 /DNA_START=231 /DNA_END=566 /DNA_ORIENTATION=+